MTALSWALLALAAAGLALGLWQWTSRRRTLLRLNNMLDRAIAGGFAEDRFDETELSALEGKLARFLRGSAAAKKAVEGEQAAVKSLIADISHQTRTPIANLLLCPQSSGSRCRPSPPSRGRSRSWPIAWPW